MEPPTPPPGPAGQDTTTEMETGVPEDDPDTMCLLQMIAIPIRLGVKPPMNLDKAGAPMDFYAPDAIIIPPLGASRVNLGLHIQLPARTEIVLQTRTNFQRRGLTVANLELQTNKKLTMLITNASHTKQRISHVLRPPRSGGECCGRRTAQ